MSDLSLTLGTHSDEGYVFGRSGHLFRGPAPDLELPYVAFLGNGGTYGKHVDLPYPELLGGELPIACVNWGGVELGPTFFLHDPVLLEACNRSRLCVISAFDAWATSNRLYRVHSKRNTRLAAVSESLEALFPDVDFETFSHVRGMLSALHANNRANFNVLELEIKDAWVSRMRELMERIETPKLLFVMADDKFDQPEFTPEKRRIGPEMVSHAMIENLRDLAEEVILYEPTTEATMPDGSDREFEEDERESALQYPGEEMHMEAAELLYPPIKALIHARQSKQGTILKVKRLLGLR